MMGSRVRTLRERMGLTQAELAERSGVSRQLVGALEAGRNLPRVDSALAIAIALGVDVLSLFGSSAPPIDLISGAPTAEKALVRVGVVGDTTVTAKPRVGITGWDVADAEVEDGVLHPLTGLRPGLVVAGCEPGLELLERLLRQAGMGALSVNCSSSAAVAAVELGRAHAAVVHAVSDGIPVPPLSLDLARFHLCRWRVGLAAPQEADAEWVQDALAGRADVIQREDGAGVQTAFVKAAERLPPGPKVSSHLEAARLSVATGITSVTIEPAAMAVGAAFHPLEIHAAELWVPRMWLAEPALDAGLAELFGQRFQRLLARVGGYDLDGCGVSVARG